MHERVRISYFLFLKSGCIIRRRDLSMGDKGKRGEMEEKD
jgi:hypothetical protein